MQPMMIVKAIAAALAIMIVNMAISYLAVAVYSYLINPGHDTAFYEEAAESIILWSAVLAGLVLFFIAGYIFAKRRPDRNAVKFGVFIWGGYFLIEIVSITAVGIDADDLLPMFGIVSLSLITKLGAIIAGAKLGARA